MIEAASPAGGIGLEPATIGRTDLGHAEDPMRQLHAAEIDREDKIPTSMPVATAPITLPGSGGR